MEPLLEQMGGWGYHWQRKGWLATHSQIETEFEQVSAILGGIQESASTMINSCEDECTLYSGDLQCRNLGLTSPVLLV